MTMPLPRHAALPACTDGLPGAREHARAPCGGRRRAQAAGFRLQGLYMSRAAISVPLHLSSSAAPAALAWARPGLRPGRTRQANQRGGRRARRGAVHASLLALYGLGGWLVSAGLVPIRVLLSAIGFTFSLVFATQGCVQTFSEARRAAVCVRRCAPPPTARCVAGASRTGACAAGARAARYAHALP